MKYRATIAGFIDRRIKVGDVVEWDGKGHPPIDGLVLVDEPKPEAHAPDLQAVVETRRGRKPKPADDASGAGDVI